MLENDAKLFNSDKLSNQNLVNVEAPVAQEKIEARNLTQVKKQASEEAKTERERDRSKRCMTW